MSTPTTALEKLRPRQMRALAALLETGSVPLAARASQVAERTLRAWVAQPPFRRAMAEQARASMRGSIAALQLAMGESVSLLRSIVLDPEAPKHLRAQCAGQLLQYGLRAAEVADLDERLAALEERADPAGSGRPGQRPLGN